MPKLFYRNFLLSVLVLGTAALIWWLRTSLPTPPAPGIAPPEPSSLPPKPASPATASVAAAPIPAPPPQPVVVPPDYYESVRLGPEQQEAEEIALNLRSFGSRFGGNPSGTNAEIVKTLNGGNPQGVRYLPEALLRLNDQGELLDSWGTPYFFHQLSAQQTEIRSAGPDKTLWTQDDILSK